MGGMTEHSRIELSGELKKYQRGEYERGVGAILEVIQALGVAIHSRTLSTSYFLLLLI